MGRISHKTGDKIFTLLPSRRNLAPWHGNLRATHTKSIGPAVRHEIEPLISWYLSTHTSTTVQFLRRIYLITPTHATAQLPKRITSHRRRNPLYKGSTPFRGQTIALIICSLHASPATSSSTKTHSSHGLPGRGVNSSST